MIRTRILLCVFTYFHYVHTFMYVHLIKEHCILAKLAEGYYLSILFQKLVRPKVNERGLFVSDPRAANPRFKFNLANTRIKQGLQH